MSVGVKRGSQAYREVVLPVLLDMERDARAERELALDRATESARALRIRDAVGHALTAWSAHVTAEAARRRAEQVRLEIRAARPEGRPS